MNYSLYPFAMLSWNTVLVIFLTSLLFRYVKLLNFDTKKFISHKEKLPRLSLSSLEAKLSRHASELIIICGHIT